MNRLPVPTRRALMVGAWAVGMAVIALVVYLLVTVLSMTREDEGDAADRADLRTEVTAQQKRADLLDQQVRELGETPIVEPSENSALESRYVPVPGAAGPAGPPGADGAAGQSLPGLPGAPGRTVVGPPGTTGPAGAEGEAGATGTSGKDGKDGAVGDPGANGQDGRGISSLACAGAVAPITFTVTYTDGSTQEFSCGSPPEPEPTP